MAKSALVLTLMMVASIGRAANPSCLALFFSTHQKIQTYLDDTLSSLERMRGENGLVGDTIAIRKFAQNVKIKSLNPYTSPTNIAVDLLIQTELSTPSAIKNVERVIATLSKVKFYEPSGLFYSRYATDKTSEVNDQNVSSIDNMHLAIALWTVTQKFAGSTTGERAKKLFERMNFSVFYDQNTGLIGGNVRPKNGGWYREAYNFANLGSEARLLYSAGWALGLFKNQSQDLDFVRRAVAALKAEVYHSPAGDLLKLWDGSAFQLFFPKMFINEEVYSPEINSFYKAAGNFMLAEGKRRGLGVPAAHSAVRNGLDNYKDKAGNTALVSSDNKDLADVSLRKTWDSTFTPYALFMAGAAEPEKYIPLIATLENIMSGETSFYISKIGFMDGLHVAGDSRGQIVPAQLSLNQGMIALSLLQMQAPDGMSLSSRLLFGEAKIRERLKEFYQVLDKKLVGMK